MAFSITDNDSMEIEVCLNESLEGMAIMLVDVTNSEGMKHTFYTNGFKIEARCVEITQDKSSYIGGQHDTW